MNPSVAGKSRSRHIGVSIALSLTAMATAFSVAPQAQAAANAVIQLSCTDASKTFKVHATLVGSGAPTARYDVSFVLTDYIDDTRAPKLRLLTINKDESVTTYPWHVGRQGNHVITNEPTSTLQQPKGLAQVILEGTTNSSDHQMFFCSDYAPK